MTEYFRRDDRGRSLTGVCLEDLQLKRKRTPVFCKAGGGINALIGLTAAEAGDGRSDDQRDGEAVLCALKCG